MKNMLSVLMSTVMMLTSSGTGVSGTETLKKEDAVSSATESVVYTVEDVRNLQDYILAKPTDKDLSQKNYDLNGDGKWDIFDFCLMKKKVFENTDINSENDTIVVYFSRTGNTEKIAEYLIDITNADSYVINAAVPYTDADIEYNNSSCRANQEQNDKTVRPEIENPLVSLDSYDTIFLGYPIWWGQEPRIIDTFLESYDFSEKTVIPFCTSASSGISTSEKNISALVPVGNQIAGKRFSASASKNDVQTWYDTLPLKKEETAMQIKIGNEILTTSMEDNSSAQALIEMLKEKSITLELHDYGNFEKVGTLPQSLTRNDEQINVDYGDLILYQGNQFSIYYDKNSWSFTKLGHIDNITQDKLKSVLGDGNVTVELSLK
ncbi:MAG: hypothetical protein J6I55_04010 [Ruminococcus sp.]|nr:hypothetical protein [Ruminococcus sp.]